MAEEHRPTLCYVNIALYHPLVLGRILSSVYEGPLPSGLIIITSVEDETQRQPLKVHLGEMSIVNALF